MILLVAPPRSPAARVARTLRPDIVVMTPADLSQAGWVLDPAGPLDGTAQVGGTVVSNREISAVIVAMTMVDPSDLAGVAAVDRSFVAEEMTAFLRTWLTGLGPAVLDAPTPTNLAGPATDAALWAAVAPRVGIQYRRLPTRVSAPRVCMVTVVDGVCFPPGTAGTEAAARELAGAAGVRACSFRFLTAGAADPPVLLGSVPWWEEAPVAVLTTLTGSQRSRSGSRPTSSRRPDR